MAVAVRVEDGQRGLEAVRHEEVLQVFIAAVHEKLFYVLVGADGFYDLSLFEGARPILVNHVEAHARLRQELRRELGVGLGGRALAALALDGELLEALREAAVDGGFPLVDVDLAGLVRVQDFEGLLQARRVQEERQVLVAARLQERNHLRLFFHRSDDLLLVQRAAAVLINELEALLRGGTEFGGELFDLLDGRLGLELALRGAVRELVGQRDLDRLLPFDDVDVTVAVSIHLGQRGLEARRDE